MCSHVFLLPRQLVSVALFFSYLTFVNYTQEQGNSVALLNPLDVSITCTASPSRIPPLPSNLKVPPPARNATATPLFWSTIVHCLHCNYFPLIHQSCLHTTDRSSFQNLMLEILSSLPDNLRAKSEFLNITQKKALVV